MRVSFTKRLSKLEQAIPSKAQLEEHQAAWREVFKEFGVPAETPIPNHIPIIRQCIAADGTPSDKLLNLNGWFFGRQKLDAAEQLERPI